MSLNWGSLSIDMSIFINEENVEPGGDADQSSQSNDNEEFADLGEIISSMDIELGVTDGEAGGGDYIMGAPTLVTNSDSNGFLNAENLVSTLPLPDGRSGANDLSIVEYDIKPTLMKDVVGACPPPVLGHYSETDVDLSSTGVEDPPTPTIRRRGRKPKEAKETVVPKIKKPKKYEIFDPLNPSKNSKDVKNAAQAKMNRDRQKQEVLDMKNELGVERDKNKELEVKVASLEGKVSGLEGKVFGLEGRIAGLEEKLGVERRKSMVCDEELNKVKVVLNSTVQHITAVQEMGKDVRSFPILDDAANNAANAVDVGYDPFVLGAGTSMSQHEPFNGAGNMSHDEPFNGGNQY